MRYNSKRKVWVVFLLSVLLVVPISYGATDSDDMIVEANIFADSEDVGDIVRIQVPDYLFLGNVSKTQKSEEYRVFVNNTGTVAITVTPELTNASEQIFDYLYFRGQKTRTVNGTSEEVPLDKIGDFSFNISKPTVSKGYEDEDFYVQLDLTDYPDSILDNIIGHRVNVRFIAVEQ